MQPAALLQIQQWNTKKRCGIFSKLTMKTPEEHQCFLMSPCQWGSSGGHSCSWPCFNINIFIIYLTWHTASYTMRRRHVSPHVTRSTILWGVQRSPELAFRSTDFCVPENLIFSSPVVAYFRIKNSRKLRPCILNQKVFGSNPTRCSVGLQDPTSLRSFWWSLGQIVKN